MNTFDIEMYKILLSIAYGILEYIEDDGHIVVSPYYLKTEYTSNPYWIKITVTHYRNEDDKIVPIYQFDIEIYAAIERLRSFDYMKEDWYIRNLIDLTTAIYVDKAVCKIFNMLWHMDLQRCGYKVMGYAYMYLHYNQCSNSASLVWSIRNIQISLIRRDKNI